MRSSLALAGTAALASAINLDVSGYRRTELGHAAINAPVYDKCYTYIQHSTYKDITDAANFDPARCIRDCEQTTAFNKQHLNGRATCRFVNTYILLKDGYSQGQICAMYTASWDPSFATNTGYTDYKGHVYSICDSYTYSNITDPGVPGKDCVGNNKPQPTTKIPSYPSTTSQIPVYPVPTSKTSSLSTVVIPTTTSKTPIVIPTTSSFSTIVVPTTTSRTPVVVTTTASTTSRTPIVITTTSSSTTSAVVLPTTTSVTPAPPQGPKFTCQGALSTPQCCQVDVLDLASLTCERPDDFVTREDFRAVCAARGSTANCCVLPLLGQGLICQDV